MIATRPPCASHMVGGLSFCLSTIRSPRYHPSSYLIIVGVCKTHPPQLDTGIPSKPMQAAPSNGGGTCVGFFVSEISCTLAPGDPQLS